MLKDEIEKVLCNYLHTVTIAHDNQPNEPHRQVIFKNEIPEIITAILGLMEKEKYEIDGKVLANILNDQIFNYENTDDNGEWIGECLQDNLTKRINEFIKLSLKSNGE